MIAELNMPQSDLSSNCHDSNIPFDNLEYSSSHERGSENDTQNSEGIEFPAPPQEIKSNIEERNL